MCLHLVTLQASRHLVEDVYFVANTPVYRYKIMFSQFLCYYIIIPALSFSADMNAFNMGCICVG